MPAFSTSHPSIVFIKIAPVLGTEAQSVLSLISVASEALHKRHQARLVMEPFRGELDDVASLGRHASYCIDSAHAAFLPFGWHGCSAARVHLNGCSDHLAGMDAVLRGCT